MKNKGWSKKYDRTLRRSYRMRLRSGRSYLWKILQRTVGRCGMASWGLPFEAIAAWMLTEDRDQSAKHYRTREHEGRN